MAHARRTLSILMLACLASCSGSSPRTAQDRPVTILPGCPSGTTSQRLDLHGRPAVDILVLVDNSMGMVEQQANLTSNYGGPTDGPCAVPGPCPHQPSTTEMGYLNLRCLPVRGLDRGLPCLYLILTS